MPTLPHFKSSQNEADLLLEEQVRLVHEELRQKWKVEPERLAVVFLDANNMIFGEVQGASYDVTKTYLVEHTVVLRNPKRMQRHVFMNNKTGEMKPEIVTSDFDMVNEGEVAVRPVAGFFLAHTDFQSQLNYARGYAQWFEGRIRARAAQAGLEVPDPSRPQSPILPPGANFKG